MAKVLLLFGFCVTLLMTSEGFLVQPQYTHMQEPCPPEERCPLKPDAVCKFDCLEVDAAGKGHDCIYNFYDANDNRVVCWL